YSIDRYTDDDTVTVRPVRHGDLDFAANQRIKVSAVIDQHYIQPNAMSDQPGMDNLGHIFALESLHVMDGLLSDSLGITITLEQLIYQTASLLSQSPQNYLTGAEQWSDANAEAFGLTDNFAMLFFRGGQDSDNNDTIVAPITNNDHIAVIGNTDSYQFATAHAFGRILGLPYETNTLLHWQESGVSLPDVLWSNTQRQYLQANPLPAAFVQSISNDAPDVADPPADKPAQEIDQQLVISERPESDGLINNDDTTTEAGSSGTGGAPISLLLLWFLLHRARQIKTCTVSVTNT
ncbi:MAG: hypothetical protein AAF404_10590, partial [Pseudomonadota bacterium]